MDQSIINGIKWSTPEIKYKGGQSCGIIIPGVILDHEDLGIKIQIDYSRSQLKNRQLAMEIFKKAIDILKVK